MFKIALNLIALRRARFAMTVLAVACMVFLFIVMTSTLDGMMLSFVGHAESTDADIFVLSASEHVTGTFMPALTAEDLAGIPGVASVAAVAEVPAYLEWGTDEIRVFASGYDPAVLTPAPLVAGGAPVDLDSRDIVIDRSATTKLPGLDVGDEVTVAGRRFTVSGIVEGHQVYAAYPIVFVPIRQLDPGSGLERLATSFLVSVEEDADLGSVQADVRLAMPQNPVYTRTEYMDALFADFGYAHTFVLALQVLVGAIGAAIVGVTVYTSVLERTRELGVIKALGARSHYLVRLVMLDGVLIAIPGFLIGAVFAVIAILVLPNLVSVRIEYEPALLVLSAVVALGVALLGSAFAAVRALRTDPIVAIRGQ